MKYFGVFEIIDNIIFYWNVLFFFFFWLGFYGWGWFVMCLVYYNENLWKYVEEISIFLY